ncbi:LPS assembly lipoprotein LptE [Rhodospirillales bacterium]|nr:LPS assembly lipoprotein LptE [Rhodospirillales bacterium]
MFRISAYVAALAVLGACGFQPIYGSRGQARTQMEMATIEVGIIKGGQGQQLRNFLLDRINPGGAPQSPNYTLTVQLTSQKQLLALKKSALSTRSNLNFLAVFNLKGKNKHLGKNFSGTSKITVSYNILSSHFATLAAEENARTRAVRELSADINNRIAAFVRRSQVS